MRLHAVPRARALWSGAVAEDANPFPRLPGEKGTRVGVPWIPAGCRTWGRAGVFALCCWGSGWEIQPWGRRGHPKGSAEAQAPIALRSRWSWHGLPAQTGAGKGFGSGGAGDSEPGGMWKMQLGRRAT